MKLLMFDMDGTLIDSGTSITNTINYVRENLGLEKLEKYFILEKVNDPTINPSEFFYGTKSFTKEQKILFEEHYDRTCLDNISLYEGIKKLIDDLQSEFILTVATNANSQFAKKMLHHLEIEKYFETILGFNDVKEAKPNPEMIHKILDKHNIKNENAQLIGDSRKDVLAANNAGVDHILVNWGFSSYENNATESINELEKKIYDKFKY